MYDVEHTEFFASIRSGKHINDGDRMATSTMVGIMGRMAAYTGQEISYEQAPNSQQNLVPDNLNWDSPAPEEPAPDPVVDPLPVTSTPDLGAATPVFSAPSFSQSALGAAPIVSAPATPAAPPAAPAATKAAPSKPAATVPAVHVSDKQWQRLMAVSLLLTMAGALWYFGGQAARAPRLLGSVGSGDLTAAAIPTVAPARAGGIGRFNKPRSAPPRRLR